MPRPDAKEFVEIFFSHPSPVIYTYKPENPQLCKVVIPETDGSFSKKSPQLGLGNFLQEAGNVRDLRSLWGRWDETGLWNRVQRQQLVDALDKPLIFFFDGPTISPQLLPEDLKDPRFINLDVRKVPFTPGLKGFFWEVIVGLQDTAIFSP